MMLLLLSHGSSEMLSPLLGAVQLSIADSLGAQLGEVQAHQTRQFILNMLKKII
jgi:hypothetical protein